MFDIKCPNCERQLQLPEDAANQKCKCPACDTVFLPSEVMRRRNRPAKTATEHVTEALPRTLPYDDADHDSDVLAERARFLRDLDDEKMGIPDEIASEFRWHQGKRAAKIGFCTGFIGGLLSLPMSSRLEVCSQLWMTFGVGVLGVIHGFLIVNLSHAMGPRHQSWTQTVLVGILTMWILGGMYLNWWTTDPAPAAVECLAVAVGSALGAVLFIWVFLAGFTMLGGVFRK